MPDTNNKPSNKKKRSYWWVKVFFLTLTLSAVFGFASETVLTHTGGGAKGYAVAIVLLALLIAINVLCDVMGTAVVTCDADAFRAMAARKIRGAKTALRILKHAEKFDNIVNDVIADICAIIAGGLAAALTLTIVSPYNWDTESIYRVLVLVGISSVVAAVIVGGKAFFKKMAMVHSRSVVAAIARVAVVFMREEKNGGKEKRKTNKSGADE